MADVTTVTAGILATQAVVPPGSGPLVDGSVTTSKIADGAVTTPKIADLAVTTLKIADAAVTITQLAPGAVDAGKIVNASVGTTKLADTAVSTAKLADAAVTSAKLALNAVTNATIADGSVSTTKLTDLGIIAGKLADGSVGTAKLADLSVNTAKLADGSVTLVKLAAASVDASKIVDASVGTAELATNAVTTVKVQDAAITGGKIAAATITMTNLASDVTTAMGSGGGVPSGRTWEINVKTDYGAIGDGVSDDSVPFQNAVNYIWTHYSNAMQIHGDGNKRANYKLIIPPGTYRIVSPKSLMSDGVVGPFLGLTFEGAGKFNTTIFFDPPSTGGYLLYNINTFAHVNMRDISFVANSSNSTFMNSTSNTATVQNYRFDNCSWGGRWGKVFEFNAVNENGEHAWYHCSFAGDCSSFIAINNGGASSEQPYKSFNFYDTVFDAKSGFFLDIARGSAINIWGGSFGYDPATTVGGTLFNLRNPNATGTYTSFTCQGARVDLPTALCKLIYCQWANGNVTFIGCDMASQQARGIGVTGGVNATFDYGDEAGASVAFIGCSLQGRHEYKYGANAYQRAARAAYQNCEVWHYKNAAEFILLTPATGAFMASVPQIQFTSCRGTPGTDQGKYVFDTDIGWNKRQTGQSQKKIMKIGNPFNGGLPGTATPSVDVWLPMNAVITTVRFWMPTGSTATAGTWTYTVKTSEDPGATVLGTVSTASPAGGFSLTQETFFVCNSDVKRHLVLSQTGVGDQHVEGICTIEYMG